MRTAAEILRQIAFIDESPKENFIQPFHLEDGPKFETSETTLRVTASALFMN